MSRYDAPCASCGKILAGTPQSLPAGKRMCHSCRRRLHGGRVNEERACAYCGATFLSRDNSSRKQLTCSRSCGQKLRCAKRDAAVSDEERKARRVAELERWRAKNRARRGPGIVAEPYRLAEIAERDGHRCGLCHRKVNMALKHPHPRSATIDHIVPLSISKDDTRANVQLAHRRCNLAKGVRAVGEQLALIG